jgi:hypothetical protein
MWRQPAQLFSWINQRWPQRSLVHCRLSGHSPRPERVRSAQPVAQHPVKRNRSVQPEPSPSPARAQLEPSSSQLGWAARPSSGQPGPALSRNPRSATVDASGEDYAAILVWNLKAAAGLVDGVRQHLCCTSRRGPLHNPHHPPRAPAQPTPPAALARR